MITHSWPLGGNLAPITENMDVWPNKIDSYWWGICMWGPGRGRFLLYHTFASVFVEYVSKAVLLQVILMVQYNVNKIIILNHSLTYHHNIAQSYDTICIVFNAIHDCIIAITGWGGVEMKEWMCGWLETRLWMLNIWENKWKTGFRKREREWMRRYRNKDILYDQRCRHNLYSCVMWSAGMPTCM